MVDEVNGNTEETKAEEIQPQVCITIAMYAEDDVRISGPIKNERDCYFLLEKAKQLIQFYNANLQAEKANGRKPGGLIKHLRGFRR